MESAGPVAQRLEQQTHNLLVLGSNPSGPTTRFNYFRRNFRFASNCKLRGSCIFLRSCFDIQPIDPRDVAPRNNVASPEARTRNHSSRSVITGVGQATTQNRNAML